MLSCITKGETITTVNNGLETICYRASRKAKQLQLSITDLRLYVIVHHNYGHFLRKKIKLLTSLDRLKTLQRTGNVVNAPGGSLNHSSKC